MGDSWLDTNGGRTAGGMVAAVNQTRIERDPLGEMPVPAATDTAPRLHQRGAFSSDEEAFIARTRAARARVVAVHCPRWLGITSSTRTLFDHTLAAPSVAPIRLATLASVSSPISLTPISLTM